MAEPLKNRYGPEIAYRIAAMISAVYPAFPARAFCQDALHGFAPLDLMARARHIARALHRHLPQRYPEAAAILMDSLGPVLARTERMGMAPFVYLPHVLFAADYGLEHFEVSMQLQHALTQRFTAEFSIRPYLLKHRAATLKRLELWAHDPSVHVRRLVSEGSRPRLPWAPRLRDFQTDPRPVLRLLELLKDDPEIYVRRSVANNLNDIGKDHPQWLADTARCWLRDATPQRAWVVRHALRSAIKRADPLALAVLGFGGAAEVGVQPIRITPQQVCVGESVAIALQVENLQARAQRVLVDLRVLCMKANGKHSPRVFKLKTLQLAPGERAQLSKTLSFAPMTTRRHYPGLHHVEALINGQPHRLGDFVLLPD